MLPIFYTGHVTPTGNDADWIPLWTQIVPAPGGTVPANPLAGAESAVLMLTIAPGEVDEPVHFRLGNDPLNEGVPLKGKVAGNVVTQFFLSPGSPQPEVKVFEGMLVGFQLGVNPGANNG